MTANVRQRVHEIADAVDWLLELAEANPQAFEGLSADELGVTFKNLYAVRRRAVLAARSVAQALAERPDPASRLIAEQLVMSCE